MALLSIFRSQIKKSDMIVILTTLSWMLSSGISVKSGVEELLADPNNKLDKRGLEAIRDELDDGRQLSEVFREHEDLFGAGRWRQVDAAERTGKIAECLDRIAEQIKSDGDLLGKVRSAVTYPIVIVLFALAAGYYMFTTLVPQMGEMLGEFGVGMPALTIAVMGFANFLIDNGFLLLIGLVVVAIVVRYLLTKPFKYQWNKLITRLPIIGSISINMNYSLIYTLLGDMIQNGANVVEALRVAAGAATNTYIMTEILSAADSMEREGYGITEALLNTVTMPADDKLMLQIGSRTGREMELLTSLSGRRRAEAYNSVGRLMEVMPTLVLLLVAAIVGTMVIAIYMPMISMATNVG